MAEHVLASAAVALQRGGEAACERSVHTLRRAGEGAHKCEAKQNTRTRNRSRRPRRPVRATARGCEEYTWETGLFAIFFACGAHMPRAPGLRTARSKSHHCTVLKGV